MSAIEWTDVTWNPVRGCSRVSEGCRNCYAERIATRFSHPGAPYHGFADVPRRHSETGRATTGVRGHWTGRVELIPSKLEEPLRWRKPRRVFVNSMSDLFHESMPDESIDQVFAVMALGGVDWINCRKRECDHESIECSDGPLAPKHTFQVLTKRPERMLGYLCDPFMPGRVVDACPWAFSESPLENAEWPLPNVWLGVSVEDQATADERIPLLLQTPAAVRFVSYEPALGPVDISLGLNGYPEQVSAREYVSHEMALDAGEPELEGQIYSEDEWQQTCPPLDWVIVGGESGPGARAFDVAWARSAIRQCSTARVPVFVKQMGSRPIDSDGPVIPEWYTGHTTADGSPRFKHPKGGDPEEWPTDLRVREFPR